ETGQSCFPHPNNHDTRNARTMASSILSRVFILHLKFLCELCELLVDSTLPSLYLNQPGKNLQPGGFALTLAEGNRDCDLVAQKCTPLRNHRIVRISSRLVTITAALTALIHSNDVHMFIKHTLIFHICQG